MSTIPIILASGSPHRRAMLENAGLKPTVVRPEIDERAVEAPLLAARTSPEDVALILAEAKAVFVSKRNPDALVIGSDQTLSLGDRLFHKAPDPDAAGRNLLAMQGRTHHLNSAVVIARAGDVIWRHVESASMTMRTLSPAQIGRYLARVGDKALSSVGAYQIESQGIALFDKVDGDHFTIVGMPLLPLLGELRRLGALDD
ncbi:MAG: Maf-like protein [Rhizobiaceae bacterium]